MLVSLNENPHKKYSHTRITPLLFPITARDDIILKIGSKRRNTIVQKHKVNEKNDNKSQVFSN